MVKLGFKKVHPDAKMPRKAHESDAGMDVCAVEVTWLKPFSPTLVKTGLVPNIPDGYELQVRPRSGLALKNGVTVWNSPGTVDSGYRGEIGVILIWTPYTEAYSQMIGNSIIIPESYRINKGDRIAQLVLAPVVPCSVEEIDDVGQSDRSKAGHGGFGSTGV